MKSTIWAHASWMVLSAGLTTAPVRVLAAEADTTATGGAPAQIEELVITARKRDETDLAVPVSVTAMSSKQIERQAMTNISDIALRVPSLSVQSNTSIGGGSITLRGIGTNAGVAGSLEQSVTLEIDGAPLARGNAIRVGQYDLGEIQVLKGPQALFFGKDSPAGVIAFRSKDPTDAFDAMGKLSYEPYANNRYGEFAVSGPLTSNLKARVFVHLSESDGEKDNLANLALGANSILPGAVTPISKTHAWSNNETFVRGTLIFQPNDAFTARLTTSYDELKGEGTQNFPEISYCPKGKPQTATVAAFLLGSSPFAPNFASPKLGALANALAVDDCHMNGKIYAGGLNPAFLAAPGVFSHAPEGFNKNTITISTAELTYRLTPQIDITSVTAFARIEDKDTDDFTWGPATIPLLAYNNYSLQSQLTEEVRVASHFKSPLNFMVGGFFENAHFDAYSQNVAIAPYVYMFYHIPNQVYSGFAQALWNVTPTLEVAAGVRQTSERKNLDMTRAGIPQPTANPRATFNDTSPEATITWRPSSTLTIYTAYKTGFKSGGYANTVTAPNPAPLPTSPLSDFLFRPEKSRGFEVGLKTELFNRTLRLDATAYSYKYTNLQVSNYTVNNGIPVQEVLNAASARQQGFELDAAYYPPAIPGLQLSAMLNYNDSHYLRFISPCFAGQAISEGCNQLLNPVTGQYTSQVLSGRELPNAPRWVGTVGFTYSRRLGNSLRLEFGSDASFKGSYNASTLLNPGGVQDASALLSAQIRLIDEAGGWEIGVFGKNLTNVYRSADSGEVPLTGNSTLTGKAGGGVNARADLEALTNPGRQVFIQLVVHPTAWLKK